MPLAKLGGRHRSSVVELSISKQTRPASVGAGRCYFNELGGSSASQHRPATPPLAPPLAPPITQKRACRSSLELRLVVLREIVHGARYVGEQPREIGRDHRALARLEQPLQGDKIVREPLRHPGPDHRF